jgi:hypothetical protein
MLPLEMERNVKDLASGVEQLVDKVVSGGWVGGWAGGWAGQPAVGCM